MCLYAGGADSKEAFQELLRRGQDGQPTTYVGAMTLLMKDRGIALVQRAKKDDQCQNSEATKWTNTTTEFLEPHDVQSY